MSPYAVMAVIAAYFAVIFLVSRLSGKGGADFYGGRKSPWWVVAIAMIGACMSGVTFVSVPGMVAVSGLGYLQMCLGFMVGYVVIAFVLMPLYYRLGVVSIYQYLEQRFGVSTYKTGAWFFFISKMLGASVRLFLVCVALQLLVFDPLGLPFALNVVVNVAIVLAYTFRNGVRSVIWTDTLKTVCMVVAVVLSIVFIARNLGFSFSGVVASIRGSEMSRIFWFDDVKHPQYFWKQFLGGLFTVIATTGLDQDMMQRALSCKDHRDSQKNLLVSTVLQTVVIFLFLCLGVLMYQFAAATGISATGDKLFSTVRRRLGPHLPDHLLLRGHPRAGRGGKGRGRGRRPHPQARACRDGRMHGPDHHHFQCFELHQRHRRRVQGRELHLRPAARPVRLRHLLEARRPRPLGPPRRAPRPGSLPGPPAQLRALVRRLQVQLRTPPPQRRLHHPRPLLPLTPPRRPLNHAKPRHNTLCPQPPRSANGVTAPPQTEGGGSMEENGGRDRGKGFVRRTRTG